MEVLYCKDCGCGNFGDDLNGVIWKAILPQAVFDVNGIALLGIGTVFNSRTAAIGKTRNLKVFVLSSGAGYFSLPEGWQDWSILAVRGPLTAQLIGRPELAATDGAALLATMPLPKAERELTLFMPHFRSLQFGQWESICEAAGVTFVSPKWEISRILELFSRARLVLAEAMHAAIVADAMRIPWIPMLSGPDSHSFKWRDWTLSLSLPYEPVHLPKPSIGDRVRSSKLYLDYLELEYGITAGSPKHVALEQVRHSIERDGDGQVHVERLPAPIAASVRIIAMKAARCCGKVMDPHLMEKTERAIKAAAQGRCYLSADSVFAEKLDCLQVARQRFVDAVEKMAAPRCER